MPHEKPDASFAFVAIVISNGPHTIRVTVRRHFEKWRIYTSNAYGSERTRLLEREVRPSTIPAMENLLKALESLCSEMRSTQPPSPAGAEPGSWEQSPLIPEE